MNGLEKEIYALELRHLQPDVRVSQQKLYEVLDEAFYEFGSSGRVWVRSDYKEDHLLSPDVMDISDFTIHELGPEAVLTTYQICNKTSGKKSFRSSVWKKRPEGWKLFFHQGTAAVSE
ncbi:DUF4440 domain-containing protein [Planococcus sp. N028]|uniref:DUF4440 domain-containing protein n=1 Tax=Planococcus shixiaomingii TaxID=3058393 RepID=A0ABT8N5D2_9BACL|nr:MULTISPECIES: DUF4440 domain-containing protein [unclassified Planococcus (in: firmicutes)]MDN7243092.1 DUF4440 domain-containing protein [Planococcus sp. N028]WKA55039.1 DUF4440 domain-containing protein [Planococcus sp. N022]